MSTQETLPRSVRFGAFEVDLRAGELRRDGRKIKLQDQPFRVLAMLIERPGEVVTREELRGRVWPGDTFVDFDQGLNKAILKIREALRDDAENPRYVETLPRRGYRFIYPVAPASPPAISVATIYDRRPSSETETAVTDRRYSAEGTRRVPLRWMIAAASGAAVVIAAAVAIVTYWRTRAVPPPRVVNYTRLTHGAHIRWGPMGTDGTRVYFNAADQAGRPIIGSVSTAGGQTVPVATPLQQPFLEDISPTGTELLVSDMGGEEKWFYIVPTEGGSARRLGIIGGNCGAWSADGREVLISSGQAIYSIERDGSSSRKLMDVRTGSAWARPSPDGRTIRFNGMTSVWEARMDGSNLHPVLAGLPDAVSGCCGAWTPDGRYFLFEGRPKGAQYVSDLWVLRGGQGLLARAPSSPVRLTSGPMVFTTPTPSRDGKRIYAAGTVVRFELLRYDSQSGEFVPFLPQIPLAFMLDFSNDGNWIAYVNYLDRTLWKCRRDGSQRIQLTFPPIQVDFPRWSPDGKVISFTDGASDKIFLVAADGGAPQNAAPGFHDVNDAGWSPDGNSLVFGGSPAGSSTTAFNILDLKSHKITKLAGSDGVFYPRWSPDGQHMAGVTDKGLVVFDFKTQKWTVLANQAIEYPSWSRDGKYLYFSNRVGEDWSVYRARIADRKIDRLPAIIGVSSPEDVNGSYPWSGLAPDDSFLLLRDVRGEEIYALDWEAP